jgi:Uma2 family endonuclease
MATANLMKRPRQKTRPRITPRERVIAFDGTPAFSMPAGSMSLAEFRQWTYADDFPTTGLIAYLGKEIFIDMSPERLRSHGGVKTEVCRVVNDLVHKKQSGKFYLDRTRISNVEAEISNEPDALYASFKSFKDGKIRFVPTKEGDDDIELEGVCDWILEIVSPGSVTKDKKTLRKKYHKAGIPEYWLIDARGDDIDFQILIHGKDDYEPAKRSGDWQTSKVFGKKFRLRPIKDELGNIDFRLDVK